VLNGQDDAKFWKSIGSVLREKMIIDMYYFIKVFYWQQQQEPIVLLIDELITPLLLFPPSRVTF